MNNYIRIIVAIVAILSAITIVIVDNLGHQIADVISREDKLAMEAEYEFKGYEEELEDEEEAIREIEEPVQLQPGDTISAALLDAGINHNQIDEVMVKLKALFDPRDLRPNHEIRIIYTLVDQNHPIKQLNALYIRLNLNTEIRIKRDNNTFIAERRQKEIQNQIRMVKGVIFDNLYTDARKSQVPIQIIHKLMKAFSYDIDFQRGIQTGDQYGLIYEVYCDPDTGRTEPGALQFAVLQLQNKIFKVYQFKSSNGHISFYNEKGESVRKGLLRTPIDGARISSLFGNRRHPILGYTKFHKGVDFAAPIGTPVMAAGDGEVLKAGFWGNYGRYIQIRHNREFSTAYAHLSRFGSGVKVGTRVRQGQIIGYVGASGRTTGPHLHYELLRLNQQINPNVIKIMPSIRLSGTDLERFKNLVIETTQMFDISQTSNNKL